MAFVYPRKQTVFVLIICIIAIFIAVIYVGSGTPNSQNEDNGSAIDASGVTSATNSVLTANDDWRKSFIEGAISTPPTVADTATSTSDKDKTLTSLVGKEVLANYLLMKQNGMNTDTDLINATADNLASLALSNKGAKIYTSSNITSVPKSDTATLMAYSNNLASCLKLYNVKKNESLITQQYLTEKNPEILQSISPITKNYQEIIDCIVSIRVPSILSRETLNLINSFSQMKFVAESLQATHEDPMRGLVGVNNYLLTARKISDSLISIQTVLNDRHVSLLYNYMDKLIAVMVSYN